MDLNNPAHPGHSDYLIPTNGLVAKQIWFPDKPLFESTLSQLLRMASASQREICGFITAEEQEIIEVENKHVQARNNFYMDERDALEAFEYIYMERQEEILGIFHSHPNDYPWPSPRDIVGWPNPQLGWRYFLITRGYVTEWELDNGPQ